MAIQVIVATKEHIDDLVTMVAAFRDLLNRPEPNDTVMRQNILRLLEDENREFIAAFGEEGKSLGFVQLRYEYSLWLSAGEVRLEDLFVWPEHRRTGIASTMIAFATERAVSRGCRGMTLETNESNSNAIALYQKLGFTTGSPRYDQGRELWFTRTI